MKKLISLFVVGLLLALSITGCNKTEDPLSYGKKYYLDATVNDEMNIYYLFNKDKTGEYHMYDEEVSYIYDYTIHFKYTFVNDGIYCAFDSIEFAEGSRDIGISHSWDSFITHYSKEIIREVVLSIYNSSSIYINEDYIDNIPNYNV